MKQPITRPTPLAVPNKPNVLLSKSKSFFITFDAEDKMPVDIEIEHSTVVITKKRVNRKHLERGLRFFSLVRRVSFWG